MSDTIAGLVARQAARTPERLAVHARDVRLSYAELNRAAAGLATLLRSAPDAPDSGGPAAPPVGVLVPRGGTQLAALLGVLHRGAAYLCLDTAQPPARVGELLRHCGVRTVVAAEPALVPRGMRVVPADPAVWSAAEPCAPAAPGPQETAYVMFTSGSDGRPKAVLVTHGGLVNYARFVAGLLDGDRQDGRPLALATLTSLATDLGNTAVFPALLRGDTVRVVPDEIVRDPFALADYCAAHPVDVAKLTPSLLEALLEAAEPGLLPGKVLVIGGETLRWELVDAVRELSGCRIINHYGPTETTVGSLVYEVDAGSARHRALASVPIGRPIANTWIRVEPVTGPDIDSGPEDTAPVAGAPATDAQEGELLIGGAGVALGYLGDERLTRERFPVDAVGGRAYLTGDMVRRHGDGVVEFLGRRDRQAKIRGYRVEPAEVEAVLCAHPLVRQAAVVVAREPAPRLLAYVVPVRDAAPPAPGIDLAGELLGLLRDRLPGHLVPARLTLLDAIPRTPSGKRDLQTLRKSG